MPREPGAARFVAYDLANGSVVLTGTGARHMLNFIRDVLWPRVDARTVEILDCGAGGPDASTIGKPIAEARARFVPVFRGDSAPGLPPVALGVVASPRPTP